MMKDGLFMSVASYDNLNLAWKSILSKETAGGIDNITLDSFGRNLHNNLESLHRDLIEGEWVPRPYLNVSIPKKDDEERTIGLLSVGDKIVQASIKMEIEPILERTFSRSSYAYRPGRGHLKCVRRALHETKTHKDGFHIRCDIDNFFASIDRTMLMKRLRQVVKDEKLLQLIDLCMSMGSVEKNLHWVETAKGIPQGAILSPMLANFFLNSFDQSIDDKGIPYLRYSDDIVMWSGSRPKAEAIAASTMEYLSSKMGLSLNEPPDIGPCSEPFEFLGIVISATKASISEKKKAELSESISNIELIKNNPTKIYLRRIDGINRYYLSVLPTEYRELFEAMFDDAKKEWKSKGIKISEKVLKDLSKRLLGNTNPNTALMKNSASCSNLLQKQRLLSKRKAEYQRLESENSELVIAGSGYFLGAGYRGLILKKAGQPLKLNSAAIKHISILSGGIAISSNLVEYCSKNGIAIDFFGEHSSHLASLMSPSTVNSSLWTAQALLSEKDSLNLAKSIMVGKLKNQLNLCKYYNKYHKKNVENDEFPVLEDSFECAEKAIADVFVDKMKDYRKSIMAYEASAAEKYWQYVRDLLSDDDVEFYSRVKQGAVDVVNCMLNYGYSMLYPRIWQALLKKGLNPYCGFIHHTDGNPNLVFDFIELFRCQAVDRIVISMLQRKMRCCVTKDGMLDDDTKRDLAQNVMTRLYRYEIYRGESRRLCDIIDIQAAALANSVMSGAKFRPYVAKW